MAISGMACVFLPGVGHADAFLVHTTEGVMGLFQCWPGYTFPDDSFIQLISCLPTGRWDVNNAVTCEGKF